VRYCQLDLRDSSTALRFAQNDTPTRYAAPGRNSNPAHRRSRKSRSGVRGNPAQHRIYGRRSACRAVWIGLGKIGKMGRALSKMWRCASGQATELYESLRLSAVRSCAVLQNRAQGGSGGHNGLDSIIAQFGTEEIPRLRIGIGAAPREESVDYVLSRFFDEEKPIVRATIDRAVEALKCAIDNGLVSAMNTFNPESVRGEQT